MPVVDNVLKAEIMTKYVGVSNNNPVNENNIIRVKDQADVPVSSFLSSQQDLEKTSTNTTEQHHDGIDEQNIEPPIYDSLVKEDIYQFDEKEYYYLTKDNMLFDFDEVVTKHTNVVHFDPSTPTPVYLCFFNIDYTGEHPFVKVWVQRQGENMYTMPSFSILFGEFLQKSDTATDELLEQKYTPAVASILNVTPEIIKTSVFYKGFLEESDHHVLFFDVTYLENEINNGMWIILDEIVNEKKLVNYALDPILMDLFNHHPTLMHIIEKDTHKPVPLPLCLFLLDSEKKDDIEEEEQEQTDDITNLARVNDIAFRTATPTPSEAQQTPNLIGLVRINHDVFGNYYYFTSYKDESLTLETTCRYAVFVYDTLYILNMKTPLRELKFVKNMKTVRNNMSQPVENDPQSNIDEVDENIDEDQNAVLDVIDDYSSIFFFENSRHIWCVKSLDRIVEII